MMVQAEIWKLRSNTLHFCTFFTKDEWESKYFLGERYMKNTVWNKHIVWEKSSEQQTNDNYWHSENKLI